MPGVWPRPTSDVVNPTTRKPTPRRAMPQSEIASAREPVGATRWVVQGARRLPAESGPVSIAHLMRPSGSIVLFIFALLGAADGAALPDADGDPEVAESPTEWGRPVAGLQVSLSLAAEARAHGRIAVRAALRNTNAGPVSLGPAEGVFGWLLVVQKTGEKKRGFYSERVSLAAEAGRWPGELGADGTIRFEAIDLSPRAAYSSDTGRQLLSAYLSKGSDEELPSPAGKLGEVLSPGPAAAKFTLLVPTRSGEPLPIGSNTLRIEILPPDLPSLAPEVRTRFIADLLAQFDRSPWAAKQAHDTAAALGRPIVPDLIAAAFESGRPTFSRMWLAAALADIQDPRCADTLVKLLDGKAEAVRRVAAYHGPKQKDGRLDAAIVANVQTSGDARMTALAMLGFLVFRGQVPEPILEAGLESEDPRARAAAAEALSKHASRFNVERLVALLGDENERVRGAAASVLGQLGVRSAAVVGALVAALDLPGETARQRIAAALCALTGHEWRYNPNDDEAARRRTIEAWKNWWAEKGKGQE